MKTKRKLLSLPSFYFLLCTLSFLLAQGCNTMEPGNNIKLTLSLEGVSSTEAWLKLKTESISSPANITLLQNNSAVQTISVESKDTTIYVDLLLPNKTYSFQAIIQSSNLINLGSEKITAQTLDTTLHNFNFSTFTFGEQGAGSSYLNDVAIVNDSSIWAVGAIYLKDSTGQPDPTPYNLVQWDGKKWNLQRIYYIQNGAKFINPIKSVFAFGNNDIWFGNFTHWNGNTFESVPLNISFPSDVNKIWGTSSNNLYIVGNEGNIAHYENGIWSKIESGTSTNINDIWGVINDQGNIVLYCPVSSFFVPGVKKILKITKGKVDSISWNRDIRLYSGWTSNENFLFVCGEGTYANKFGNWNKIDLPEVGTNSIRGNNINDIFIVGDYGFKAHFNGISWKIFTTFNYKGYSKVNMKQNIVAICGNYQGLGVLEIGKRN